MDEFSSTLKLYFWITDEHGKPLVVISDWTNDLVVKLHLCEYYVSEIDSFPVIKVQWI